MSRRISSFSIVLGLVVTMSLRAGAQSSDADAIKALSGKGVKIEETKGIVTSITVADGAKLTDEDFRLILRFTKIKMLSLSNCLNDERVALLQKLAELEYLQTNLAQVTDEGIKPLALLKSLRNIKFFHPGKEFTGSGLAHLASLPQLQSLTVAGSFAFNDDGMAGVAKIAGLKEFRTWHAGSTDEGVRKLRELKKLTSLTLGQRLTYKKPASPSNETIAILAEMRSLETLQIDEARLSLAALSQLKQLPNLKKLNLGGIDMPKDDVGRLERELPMVKIQWSPPSEVFQKRINALFGTK